MKYIKAENILNEIDWGNGRITRDYLQLVQG